MRKPKLTPEEKLAKKLASKARSRLYHREYTRKYYAEKMKDPESRAKLLGRKLTPEGKARKAAYIAKRYQRIKFVEFIKKETARKCDEFNGILKKKKRKHKKKTKEARRASENRRKARRLLDSAAFACRIQLSKRIQKMLGRLKKRGFDVRRTARASYRLKDLEQQLSMRFSTGMGWHNYGSAWHVDHIRPCASFDLTDPEQQRLCFHHSNLQPLWAEINVWKSDRILAPHELEYEIAMVPFPS